MILPCVKKIFGIDLILNYSRFFFGTASVRESRGPEVLYAEKNRALKIYSETYSFLEAEFTNKSRRPENL
jgi:hypothetical protein